MGPNCLLDVAAHTVVRSVLAQQLYIRVEVVDVRLVSTVQLVRMGTQRRLDDSIDREVGNTVSDDDATISSVGTICSALSTTRRAALAMSTSMWV